MATTSIADKLAKLEKKIAKREKAIADETKELDKDRAEYNKLYIMFLSDKYKLSGKDFEWIVAIAEAVFTSTSIDAEILIALTIIHFYHQCNIYLSVFLFIVCSYLLLSEFMRPLRPVQSLLSITRLMRKLTNE